MLELLSAGLILAAGPTADAGPEISEAGYCASVYGALARAQGQGDQVPSTLRKAAGFATIDFAARQGKVGGTLPATEGFAVTWWQQALEESFDQAADNEADGGSGETAVLTHALTAGRDCDRSHAFTPMLLDQVAAWVELPVEPYWCAVNYFTLGMGMAANPAGARQMQAKIQVALTQHDPEAFGDSDKGAQLRDQIRGDANERNRAVASGQLKPEDLFGTAQACDRLFASAQP